MVDDQKIDSVELRRHQQIYSGFMRATKIAIVVVTLVVLGLTLFIVNY